MPIGSIKVEVSILAEAAAAMRNLRVAEGNVVQEGQPLLALTRRCPLSVRDHLLVRRGAPARLPDVARHAEVSWPGCRVGVPCCHEVCCGLRRPHQSGVRCARHCFVRYHHHVVRCVADCGPGVAGSVPAVRADRAQTRQSRRSRFRA